MGNSWQLQEAKNRLSEVVDQALANGPQMITRRGVETAVLVSVGDFRKMSLPKQSFVAFFRDSPLVGADVDLSRDQTPIPPPLKI